MLSNAFSKYTSFLKAKVIRDKRTGKTKGYGFVSFSDPMEFIKALNEMNGRYTPIMDNIHVYFLCIITLFRI